MGELTMTMLRWIHKAIRTVALPLGSIFVIFAAWPQGHAAALETEPDFFDPDGYYFPAPDLVVSGYRIDWIELTTLEYYFDGELHYEKPRFLRPSARLMLTHLADEGQSSYDCPQPIIRQDLLAIVCPTTPIGVVTIRGTFADKRGQFWNRNDVIPQKTIIADSKVTISKDGKDKKSHRVVFTYWEGD